MTEIHDPAASRRDHVRLLPDIEAASGPAPRPDAASFAERFSAIQEDIADERAKTSGLDRSEVVDQGSWDLLSAAITGRRHISRTLCQTWPLTADPSAQCSRPTRLCVIWPDRPDIAQERQVAVVLEAESAALARSPSGTAPPCRLVLARECGECRRQDGRKSAASSAPPGRSTRYISPNALRRAAWGMWCAAACWPPRRTTDPAGAGPGPSRRRTSSSPGRACGRSRWPGRTCRGRSPGRRE